MYKKGMGEYSTVWKRQITTGKEKIRPSKNCQNKVKKVSKTLMKIPYQNRDGFVLTVLQNLT